MPEVNILNGCNLSVGPGEFVGIIGPNGAGKSTFLKAVFGLVPVRSGTVLLHGQDITGQAAHKLVAAGRRVRAPDQQRVPDADACARTSRWAASSPPKRFGDRYDVVTGLFPRLAERADQKAGSLSGGERQMVAMGRALMLDPSLAAARRTLGRAVTDAAGRGVPALQADQRHRVAILMVEQNARRCLQVCDRGYVLDQGRNAYTASGRELLGDPKVIELYLGTLARA